MDLTDRALAEEWDDLAARTASTPFHRHGWYAAWWGSFGPAAGRLEILTARRDGKLVGVLPVVDRHGVLGAPANWHTFVHGPLAEDDDAARELWSRYLDRCRFTAHVEHLPAADRAQLVGVAEDRRFTAVPDTMQRSPYIAIDGSFDGYARTRDTRWLRQLESRRRKLDRAGELGLEVHDGSAGARDLDRVLTELFRVEALGWKSEAGTAIVSRPDTHSFYAALARWAASAGLLRVALLTLDGRTIAADLALEDERSHYFLKTGFDPELRTLAPGLILRRDMVARAFETGLATYEFLGSADRYKLDWTDTVHEIDEVRLYPRSAGGLAARGARQGARVARRAAVELTRLARRSPEQPE
ncbi:GNAT family N-acetyltransferase [Pseudonocardia sp. N23]|uniref:GNAT family N-acetyltransferase n=1 Tax=Pseudonocardia sp. N23 TaxID=1987376 RepID=UPI000BFC6CF7|nr:GNAT family N-acetyltransferase [Pseudonocardia sp. N23]GAY12209.1 cellulose biosynthesis CelD-like protein [Pseudonocardia sp. N23]